MASLFEETARSTILRRLDQLTPDATPRWGRMCPPEMLAHQEETLRYALREIDAAPVASPLAWPLVSWLGVHVMPWPKGKAQSPAEFLAGRCEDWEAKRTSLKGYIARFVAQGPAGDWPASPVFGRLSGKSWGVLAWRHFDHHLKQFGV